MSLNTLIEEYKYTHQLKDIALVFLVFFLNQLKHSNGLLKTNKNTHWSKKKDLKDLLNILGNS